MPIPKKVTHFDCFVDGHGHAGVIEEVELPKLTLKMEEWRGGGMDTPAQIDLGTEKLEATLTLGENVRAILKLWGLFGSERGLTLRASQGAGAAAEGIVVEMRGTCAELDMGTLKAGDANKTKHKFALSYYRLAIGGEDLIEIDIENMVRKVGGVDQLAAVRKNLGR